MTSQKRPLPSYYREEEYPPEEEEYDEQAWEEERDDGYAEPEGEDFAEDYEEEEVAVPPPQPVKPAPVKRAQAKDARSHPRTSPAGKPPAKQPPAGSKSKKQAVESKNSPKPHPVVVSRPQAKKPSAAKPKAPAATVPIIKSEPRDEVKQPISEPSSKPPAKPSAKQESVQSLAIDVQLTLQRYFRWLDKTFTPEQLKEKFKGPCYLSNYELPSCLLEDFDLTELPEMMVQALRNERGANKRYLRYMHAWTFAQELKKRDIPIRGFARENTKKQGNHFTVTEALAGGEKRPDQARNADDIVANVVYIGDPFQYPQKDTPEKVPVPENDQKRIGAFSCKSFIVYFRPEQRQTIAKQLDQEENERVLENLRSLRKIKEDFLAAKMV